MAGPDFYTILGVSPLATADEIKAAHRELVKIFHPDLFSLNTEKARANHKLQEINEAYATLSNPERRRQYDVRRAQEARPAEPRVATARRTAPSSRRRSAPPPAWRSLVKLARDKFRRIRAVYQTMAEAERRQESGTGRTRESQTSRHRSATTTNRSPSRSPVGLIDWKDWARRWRALGPAKKTAGIVGIVVMGLILHALWDEPQASSAWTLLELTSVESSQQSAARNPGEGTWVRLGSHGSMTQCVISLKQKVAMDERAGSKVFLDERSGTMAMTIKLTSEAVLAEQYFAAKLKRVPSEGVDREALEQEAREEAKAFVKKNGFSQTVKNYQCRELQIVQPESWLRKKLRQLGFVS